MALAKVDASPTAGQDRAIVAAAAADTSGSTPRLSVVAGSFLLVLLALAVGLVINRNAKPEALALPVGVSLFAMLYAVTQGLERFLEPLSAFFFSTKEETANRNNAVAAAVNSSVSPRPHDAIEDVRTVARQTSRSTWRTNTVGQLATDARTSVAALLQQEDLTREDLTRGATRLVAATQAELDQRRSDKAIAYWALASTLGILLSSTIGMYLLHVVGLRGDGLTGGTWTAGIASAASARHALDILLTGLAIGGGTKPLHDLISNLQQAKEAKKDPSSVTG